ncbi:glycerophosphodiester phosphodiesterase family protein [Micromonospora sp. NPDC003197]
MNIKKSRVFAIVGALTAGLLTVVTPATPAAALPACPQIFGHGGYPTQANPWDRDQVRQPNHPRGLTAQKSWGASGVEADLQLTKNGTKAVMWHNTTTNGLTGTRKAITELWWATGSDMLKGRTISRGPYTGETVYTFREWLDAARARQMIALVEVKGEAKQSLLNADSTIKAAAWKEVIDPIKERIAGQEIMIYTHDTALKPELESRITAAGLGATLTNRPTWVDSVGWEEPPPAASGNYTKWQSTLNQGPKRIATSWTKDYKTWLAGKCA